MPYNPLIMYFLYILTLRLLENRARKEDIDVTLLLFDRLKQPIEIIQVAGITLHAGDILADFFDCITKPFGCGR